MTAGEPSVMIVCGGASICDWNGHSWSDCEHDEGESCECSVGPCRYCGQTHEQAALRAVEFAREMKAHSDGA